VLKLQQFLHIATTSTFGAGHTERGATISSKPHHLPKLGMVGPAYSRQVKHALCHERRTDKTTTQKYDNRRIAYTRGWFSHTVSGTFTRRARYTFTNFTPQSRSAAMSVVAHLVVQRAGAARVTTCSTVVSIDGTADKDHGLDSNHQYKTNLRLSFPAARHRRLLSSAL